MLMLYIAGVALERQTYMKIVIVGTMRIVKSGNRVLDAIDIAAQIHCRFRS